MYCHLLAIALETYIVTDQFNFCFPLFTDKSVRITPERPYSPPSGHPHTVTPRKSVPIPTRFEPPQFDISPIPADGFDEERIPGDHDRVERDEVRDYSPKKSPLKEIQENTGQHVRKSLLLILPFCNIEILLLASVSEAAHYSIQWG